MDERTVRDQLEEVRQDLRRIEEEREVLLSLARGLEGWLRLHSVKPVEPVEQGLLPIRASLVRTRPITFTDAILEVLREAYGEQVHAKDIVERAKRKGAVVNAKNPAGVVDTILLTKFAKKEWSVQRHGKRYWSYVWPSGDAGVPPTGGNGTNPELGYELA